MNTQNATDQKKNQDNQKGDGFLSKGLGLAVAMALGATLGVLFAPKEGKETQKDLMGKAQELAKNFKKNRVEIQESIQKVFGEVTKELEENYLELEGNILARMDELKDKAELTKQKYEEIVQDTVEQFSKGKKWSGKNIQALIKELQKDWK